MSINNIIEELNQYKQAFPTCEEHRPSKGTRSGCLICAYYELTNLLYGLDEALNTNPVDPEYGFVSGIDILYTHEDVINRAITRLKAEEVLE